MSAYDITIRIAGAAGQGIQTTAFALGKLATRSGLFAFSHTDAESRIRGGLNFTQVRISEKLRPAIADRFDILIAHTSQAMESFGGYIDGKGWILAQEDWEHRQRAPFTLRELAKEAGSELTAGTVALAVVGYLLGIDETAIETIVHNLFEDVPRIEEINQKAVRIGGEAARKWNPGSRFRFDFSDKKKDRIYLSGGQAIALGAVAGGVSFMSAYPMSPSTSIITNLAQWADETGIVVEQAEDEIAAINMVAGASYSGARAMTATSGGGFDLMSEGVSLIGMAELPAVIVLGQRPGPATNQATKTQQNDLHLVLHAGHGHFARVVLAPKDIADGFCITAKAFDIAEKYQVPVFILTDQQLQDGEMTTNEFGLASLPDKRHLLDGDALREMDQYRRFETSPSGISPMAPPGASEHLVVFTSDEHPEDGHITEDPEKVRAMVGKRLRKVDTIARELAFTPEPEGNVAGGNLVIGWGSSYHVVAEARRKLADDGIEFAHLHLRQMWPLDGATIAELFDLANHAIVVENNLNGELADLLQRVAIRRFEHRITKIDGRPFSVEELVERIGKAIKS